MCAELDGHSALNCSFAASSSRTQSATLRAGVECNILASAALVLQIVSTLSAGTPPNTGAVQGSHTASRNKGTDARIISPSHAAMPTGNNSPVGFAVPANAGPTRRSPSEHGQHSPVDSLGVADVLEMRRDRQTNGALSALVRTDKQRAECKEPRYPAR